MEGHDVAKTDGWINGVMIDCVRITERYDYYLKLIPRLARWGYNTLFWHFTDDQGCALRLRSHPGLASRYALKRGETERLIRLAARHGIEVVPEVEALGHCRWITHLPRYAHLFDGSEGHFNALKPSHPEVLRLLGDVLAEVAEVFPSPWLHVGLDEVQFGRKRRGKAAWRLFADHVNDVHKIVTGLGKRVVLWGDHLVKDARIARRVPRDCLVAHWDYFAEHPLEADTRTLLGQGFEVLCCPASARVFTTVVPDESNLANLRAFTRIAHRHRRRGILGVVNTVWCPERQLGASTHWGMALGAALAADPAFSQKDEAALAETFVREEYGIARPAAPARALRQLHATAPGLAMLRKALVERPASHVRGDQYVITPADVADAAKRRAQLAKIIRRLDAARPRATRRRGEFGVWITAARILDEQLSRFQAWQDAAVLDRLRVAAVKRRDRAAARQLARDIAAILREAARGARCSARLAERQWRLVRRAADPRRTGRDGYVRSDVALPGLLDRTAKVLERTAARARKVAATGKGSLALPKGLVALSCRPEQGAE